MAAETEELQIELDDETAAIAEALAKEKGVSVEDLLQQLLSDAIESGYFDNAENVTTDDPLEWCSYILFYLQWYLLMFVWVIQMYWIGSVLK